MNIEKLNWDSDFFGIKVGRLIVSDSDVFDAVSFEKEAILGGFDLIYVISLKEMLDFDKLLPLHIGLMDVQITMSKNSDKTECVNYPFEFRTELSISELDECYTIVEQTASVSRFFKEPLIGAEKTKQLYRRWLENAVNTNFADGIIIAKKNNKIVGIHIVKTNSDIGHCSVIGVSENEKGSGIGRDLWFQALSYWNSMGTVKKYHVPFSIQNSESFNFHLKIGFNKVEEVKYIYHYRK